MVVTDDDKHFKALKLRFVSQRHPIPEDDLRGLEFNIYFGLTEAALSEPSRPVYDDDTLTLCVVCVCNGSDIAQCTAEIVRLLGAELYANSYALVRVYQRNAIVDFIMLKRNQFLVGQIKIEIAPYAE